MAVIEAAGLAKRYAGGVIGLRGLDVRIERGELVGLLGPSGSGKTTLFRLLVGALRPSEGHLSVLGQPLAHARTGDLRRLRRRLALVYQQHNLVPSQTVLHNVLLGRLGRVPLWRALGWTVRPSAADCGAVLDVLADLDIADKAHSRVDTLSGGQQQRVAVARALLDPPELLLADEPIASVDAATATLILDRFQRLAAAGSTVLVSLHQTDFARRYCSRVLVLARGALTYDGPPTGWGSEPHPPIPSPARGGGAMWPSTSGGSASVLGSPLIASSPRGRTGAGVGDLVAPPLPVGEGAGRRGQPSPAGGLA